MNYKHACIIDMAGFYKTLVLVLFEQNEEGKTEEKIQHYTLQEGETLLDAAPSSGFVKARWNGSAWVEGATPEEIAQWEQEHPAPPAPEPTEEQKRLANLETQVTDTQMALADTYEQADAQNTDMLMATAEVYETLLALQERVAALEGGATNNG